MKKLHLFKIIQNMRFQLSIIICFIAFQFTAQTTETKVPHLVKRTIENTPCTTFFPDDEDPNFELSYSPDSSKVYTGEVYSGDHHFSLILIELNGMELQNVEEKENILINYLDYLQGTFNIASAAGYGKGHKMESDSDAVGVIDYWEDMDGDQWAVKAWANKKFLAVLMLYGPIEYPLFNVQQLFLDGFRFK